MIKDLISVVIPTYNDAHYLKDCLDDLLKQTYKEFEVLIVNDGSTDNTEEIVRSYCDKDPRFKLFTKKNGGTGSALNYGFEKAEGEFGTWISSDDRKTEVYLETLVTCLKQNRDVEFVVSAFYSEFLNKNIRAVVPDLLSPKLYKTANIINTIKSENDFDDEKPFIIDEWIDLNYYACHLGVNYMFTMRLQRECGKYLEMPGEDYHMAVLMGTKTRVAYINKVLGRHNSPPDALSNINRSCVAEANVITRTMILDKYMTWHMKNIPKVAHFYWGSEKMSYMRYMTLYSFKKMNPDWSVKLYVPKELTKEKTWVDSFHQVDTVDYKSEYDYFEKIKELPIKIVSVDFPENIKKLGEAQKSDYLRWRLLYKEGGLWSDMDILYIRPMNKVYFNNNLNNELDNTLSIIPNGGGHQIGFYLSTPKNTMFKELCFLSSNKNDVTLYQDLGCELLNQYLGSKENIEEKFNLKTINVDQSVFYKFDHTKLDKLYSDDVFAEQLLSDERVLGIHWYGGASISQEYNNKINHTNYNNSINNTIISAIKHTIENEV